jgi:hypothetical protein
LKELRTTHALQIIKVGLVSSATYASTDAVHNSAITCLSALACSSQQAKTQRRNGAVNASRQTLLWFSLTDWDTLLTEAGAYDANTVTATTAATAATTASGGTTAVTADTLWSGIRFDRDKAKLAFLQVSTV